MNPRLVRRFLFIVAVLGGLFFNVHVQAVDGPAAAFVGDWCNQDFATWGITRVRIYLDGDKIMVHMWGRCHPMECDWGETTAKLTAGDNKSLSLSWDQGFASSVQTLLLQADGTLWLAGDRTYNDKREPRKESGVYEKDLRHNWNDPAAPPKK